MGRLSGSLLPLAEIDRRAEDEGVGNLDLFKYGCQAILHGTFTVTLSFVDSR
jgi:hypothetical protein